MLDRVNVSVWRQLYSVRWGLKSKLESNLLHAAFQTNDFGCLHITLVGDTEDRWKITLSWEWRLHLCIFASFWILPSQVWFWAWLRFVLVFSYKSEYGHAGKSKLLRDKNVECIFLIGISYCFLLNPSHCLLLTHGTSRSLRSKYFSNYISLFCLLSCYSEEVLWSHGISAALVRWKTDGFLSGQQCF